MDPHLDLLLTFDQESFIFLFNLYVVIFGYDFTNLGGEALPKDPGFDFFGVFFFVTFEKFFDSFKL